MACLLATFVFWSASGKLHDYSSCGSKSTATQDSGLNLYNRKFPFMAAGGNIKSPEHLLGAVIRVVHRAYASPESHGCAGARPVPIK